MGRVPRVRKNVKPPRYYEAVNCANRASALGFKYAGPCIVHRFDIGLPAGSDSKWVSDFVYQDFSAKTNHRIGDDHFLEPPKPIDTTV